MGLLETEEPLYFDTRSAVEEFIVNIGREVDDPSEFYYRTQFILPYVRVRQMRTTTIACNEVTGIAGMAEVYPDSLMC